MPSSQGRIIILTIFCSMHEEPTGPYKLPLLKRPFVWDDVATSDLTLISTIWAWLILWFWMNIHSNQSTLFLHPLWSDPQQPHNHAATSMYHLHLVCWPLNSTKELIVPYSCRQEQTKLFYYVRTPHKWTSSKKRIFSGTHDLLKITPPCYIQLTSSS